MQATLVSDADERVELDVPAEGRIEIYRDQDRNHEVMAAVSADDGAPIGLGQYDPSVSRRPKEIQVFRDDGEVFVIDTGSSESVELSDVFESVELTAGQRYAVHQDSELHLGYDTTLEVRLEGGGEEVPIAWRIDECRRWVDSGKTDEIIRSAEALWDQLRTRGRDGEAYEEAHEAFENFLDNAGARVKLSRGGAGPSLERETIENGKRSLDRLQALYGQ